MDKKKFDKAFKAAVFKVKISNKKANIIDTQMRLAESAFFKAISSVTEHVDILTKLDKKQRKEAYSSIGKSVAQLIKPLPLANGIKDGVLEDVMAQLKSTVELIETGQAASLPSKADRTTDYYTAGLQGLLLASTKEEEDIARDLMYTKPYDGMPRPLSWLRSRPSDGAMLLQDKQGRFFIYLNTHSSKSKFASQKTQINEMIHIRTGEVISFKSGTGILLPIELSKWHQEEFLEKGTPQSYKLIKQTDGYYLAVSFEYIVERVTPETELGVDRGFNAIAAYSVVDDNRIIATGCCSGHELREYQRKMELRHKKNQAMGRSAKKRWAGFSDIVVHKIANEIVELAFKHKSQVVMENLKNIANGHHHKRPKFARKSNFSRMLGRQQYQKLQHILEYKLKCKGLPPPKYVFAAGTSITCNACGHKDKANRNGEAFECVKCGRKDHADVQASMNIAMKQNWLETSYDKRKNKMKISFEDWLALTD